MKCFGFVAKEWPEWGKDYSRAFGCFEKFVYFLMKSEENFAGMMTTLEPQAETTYIFFDLNGAKSGRNILREKWETSCGEIKEVEWNHGAVKETN